MMQAYDIIPDVHADIDRLTQILLHLGYVPDGASPTGRVGDRLGGGKGLRVLLQPLHAEELPEDRLFELGLRANPPANATGRVSKGIVRSHSALSARP